MSPKPVSHVELSPTLSLTEFGANTGYAFNAGRVRTSTGEKLSSNGFWLYDETQGMNLAMSAESERAAFIEAIEYYQERTQSLKTELATLKAKVDSFLVQFESDDDEEQS